ncbi:isochorismatase hydrolase [Phycomyces nitens]|nr:isochorismatase hydrolase [Phycomyces nitens]
MSSLSNKVALILVDVQYDFLETGSLPVPKASEIIPVITKLIKLVKDNGGLIVATQDWHSADHISFASNHKDKSPFESITIYHQGIAVDQVLWPAHCVQNTHGARIVDTIPTESIDHVIQKGTNPNVDSYSGFADNQYFEITPLAKTLYQNRVETVLVAGLAADYCVKMTCLDAIKFGFKTVLTKEATRAVVPHEFDSTMDSLKSKGVTIANLEDLSFA